MAERVLVTGGTGYLAGHTIVALLRAGYRVRATLRSIARAPDVQEAIAEAGEYPDHRLTFAEADLTRDEGWAEAMAGMNHLVHIAAPFPAKPPADPDSLVEPILGGTQRVLAAAREAGVESVVMVSSFATIGFAPAPPDGLYTEHAWTDPSDHDALVRAQTLAERAAWADVGTEGGYRLTVINPVGILGPVLSPDYSASIHLVDDLLQGRYRLVPARRVAVVHVSDVADLVVSAIETPEAAGQRYIATGGELSMRALCRIVREGLGSKADRVPWIPAMVWWQNLMQRIRARRPLLWNQMIARPTTSAAAIDAFGWEPEDAETAVLDCAESLAELYADQIDGRSMPVMVMRM